MNPIRFRINPLLLFACTLFFASAEPAAASCCNVLQCVTASDACNVFCCNCDGPCSNYGVTCANGPVIVGDVLGMCPGYDNCTPTTYCNPGYTCCNNNTQCCPSSGANAQPTRPLAAALRHAIDKRNVATGADQNQVCADRYRSIDANGDKVVTRAEFAAGVKKQGLSLGEAELKKAFDDIDQNHDGKIEPGEFDKRLK